MPRKGPPDVPDREKLILLDERFCRPGEAEPFGSEAGQLDREVVPEELSKEVRSRIALLPDATEAAVLIDLGIPIHQVVNLLRRKGWENERIMRTLMDLGWNSRRGVELISVPFGEEFFATAESLGIDEQEVLDMGIRLHPDKLIEIFEYFEARGCSDKRIVELFLATDLFRLELMSIFDFLMDELEWEANRAILAAEAAGWSDGKIMYEFDFEELPEFFDDFLMCGWDFERIFNSFVDCAETMSLALCQNMQMSGFYSASKGLSEEPKMQMDHIGICIIDFGVNLMTRMNEFIRSGEEAITIEDLRVFREVLATLRPILASNFESRLLANITTQVTAKPRELGEEFRLLLDLILETFYQGYIEEDIVKELFRKVRGLGSFSERVTTLILIAEVLLDRHNQEPIDGNEPDNAS